MDRHKAVRNEFADTIRKYMYMPQFDPSHLARYLGVPKKYVDSIMQGEALPSRSNVIKIARYIGGNKDELLKKAGRWNEHRGTEINKVERLGELIDRIMYSNDRRDTVERIFKHLEKDAEDRRRRYFGDDIISTDEPVANRPVYQWMYVGDNNDSGEIVMSTEDDCECVGACECDDSSPDPEDAHVAIDWDSINRSVQRQIDEERARREREQEIVRERAERDRRIGQMVHDTMQRLTERGRIRERDEEDEEQESNRRGRTSHGLVTGINE